jgi:hypothetical protein
VIGGVVVHLPIACSDGQVLITITVQVCVDRRRKQTVVDARVHRRKWSADLYGRVITATDLESSLTNVLVVHERARLAADYEVFVAITISVAEIWTRVCCHGDAVDWRRKSRDFSCEIRRRSRPCIGIKPQSTIGEPDNEVLKSVPSEVRVCWRWEEAGESRGEDTGDVREDWQTFVEPGVLVED